MINGQGYNEIKTVVLSKSLNRIEILKQELNLNNIHILDGKYLFKTLVEEVIRYICIRTHKYIETMELSILINENSNINKQIILNLVQKVKRLNIITNKTNQFQDIEDYLYNEMGIMIKISNNKKIDLLKSDIIINLDFNEAEINKYTLPNKCVILNTKEDIKIKSKKFNGINVNNFNIIMPEEYQIEGFNDNAVYERYIFGKQYNIAIKQIKTDKIKISNLIGEKGVINNLEFIFVTV